MQLDAFLGNRSMQEMETFISGNRMIIRAKLKAINGIGEDDRSCVMFESEIMMVI